MMFLGIVGVLIFFILFTQMGWWTPAPPPASSPPGDYPEITYLTEVRLEEPWWTAQPHIEWIKSSQSSTPYTAAKADLVAFPWGGKLKLTITYPGGQVIQLQQNVKVEWNSGKTVPFYWKTKQVGTHLITAELYNGDGMLIDSKTVSVDAPYR
ncbi:hypothetical protein DRP07_00045 [Archaeoglobales archaeon]|nr:MAG: hypothetical protein DRP07_00045 [Archaeoglobales archaeon]